MLNEIAKIKVNKKTFNPFKSKYQEAMTKANKHKFLDFYLDGSVLQKIKELICNFSV